ncbi:MAG: IS110 family RNA-guided transposase [Thermoleophilia bacterium]
MYDATTTEGTKVTVGLDLGDRYCQVCVLDEAGEVTEEGRVPTKPEALRRRFSGADPVRIVLEAGTHSPWISRLLAELGHDVIVANPRKLRLIYQNDSKSDRVDAEYLARVGRLDPALLSPLTHRGAETQADLALLRSRNVLVRARTRLISHTRGTTKSLGGRLPACGSDVFARKVGPCVPEELTPALSPVLSIIQNLSEEIRALDERIEEMAKERYPETALLSQVPGVGTLTATVYVLTVEDPARFPKSRAVGSYLGLRPRQASSGSLEPQLRITKAGDEHLRWLLVGAAHYILGPFGPDSDLRRWGLKLAAQGGKRGKKRVAAAVARKLSVLLLRLWQTGEVYEPLRNARLRGDVLTANDLVHDCNPGAVPDQPDER